MTGLGRTLALLCLALSSMTLVGCGGEDRVVPPTPTPTPPQGPVVTFIGLATPSDYVIDPNEVTDGIPFYTGHFFSTGRGFRIVIEGKPGLSGADPGTSAFEQSPQEFPDLQVIVSQPLGNGSEAVCDFSGPNPDGTPTPGGGVPATDPASFEPTDTVAPRVNDLSCRFVDGNWDPVGRTDPGYSCVKDRQTDTPGFANQESTIQFCALVDRDWPFPAGTTTVLTARLRDVEGNVGPPAQLELEVIP